MEEFDANWLQGIRPRGSAEDARLIKGAFQYNGGHGLATFFVDVEPAGQLRQILSDHGLDAADTVIFSQQTEGGWVAAFGDEGMTKRVEFALKEGQMQTLMQANDLHLIHV